MEFGPDVSSHSTILKMPRPAGLAQCADLEVQRGAREEVVVAGIDSGELRRGILLAAQLEQFGSLAECLGGQARRPFTVRDELADDHSLGIAVNNRRFIQETELTPVAAVGGNPRFSWRR
jgi:hypothetical protein